MNTMVRQPAVAGQFYPGTRELLRRDVEQYTRGVAGEKIRALGCVVPHAGYMYSGHVAGAVYARLELPQRYVILCPNHTGIGSPLALMSRGAWLTPLGEVRIDEKLAAQLKRVAPIVTEDSVAHRAEHALEVQLPFLQVLAGDISFVPIAVGTGNLEALIQLGEAIANIVDTAGDQVMIVASSDMNHYESDEATRIKDSKAIERVESLDPRGLYEVVKRENITMCGYGPTIAMLTAALKLGATKATLIKYATSGDVSGDRDWVVGYAGIAVS